MMGSPLARALGMIRRPGMAGGGQPPPPPDPSFFDMALRPHGPVRSPTGADPTYQELGPPGMSFPEYLKYLSTPDQIPQEVYGGPEILSHLPTAPIGPWPYNHTDITPFDPTHARQWAQKTYWGNPKNRKANDKVGLSVTVPYGRLLKLLRAMPQSADVEISNGPWGPQPPQWPQEGDISPEPGEVHEGGEQAREMGEKAHERIEENRKKDREGKSKEHRRGGRIRSALALARRPRKTARRRK